MSNNKENMSLDKKIEEFVDNEDLENGSENQGKTRRDFVVMTATAIACAGAIAAAVPFGASLKPDAGVVAVGSTEVDITNIKIGQTITVVWRGQPVFITRRTKKQIEEAQNADVVKLRDPEADNDRIKAGYEEWLVTVAICTHLGCVPLPGKGNYDGYFCPCHGSQYDSSGRVMHGPAPSNLAIPPYVFVNDNKILIG